MLLLRLLLVVVILIGLMPHLVLASVAAMHWFGLVWSREEEE